MFNISALVVWASLWIRACRFRYDRPCKSHWLFGYIWPAGTQTFLFVMGSAVLTTADLVSLCLEKG